MFAGIIEKKAKIVSAQKQGGILRVRITKPARWKLARGQSVDIDGICSTVIRSDGTSFEVEYMPETLSKTTAALFANGRMVNLERSLKYGQRIDGHPVQGHVDAASPVREIVIRGASKEITIRPNASLARQAVPRGSIAINGVSLTIAKKHGPNITIALIPHTLKETNLGSLTAGDPVNLEFDHSAAYLVDMRKR